MYFFNLREIDNCNKWKNYFIVASVKLSLEIDALVLLEQSMFIQIVKGLHYGDKIYAYNLFPLGLG